MTDIVRQVQDAVSDRNYTASSQLLDEMVRNGSILDFVLGLEAIQEVETHVTLEIRDHIFYYLGMWDIYYAVQIPSIDVLKILHENTIRDKARTFMVRFIRDLLDSKDNRFDQFCLNISTISTGHYAVLVPSVLEQRTDELLKSRIQFLEGPPLLYCAADLLETYYGRKILNAALGNRSFDIIINEDQYTTIRESLALTGLDSESLLVKIDAENWDEYVKSRRSPRNHSHSSSSELSLLHRVKSARSNIYASSFNSQNAALNAIIEAKTQLCNDVLMDVASDPAHQMRKRAVKQLGESGDSTTLVFLNNILKNDGDISIRTEGARASSALSSRIAGLGFSYSPPLTKPPAIDISKINIILNSLIENGMPTTMIDDTLNSVALQGGSDSGVILLRLFGRPQMIIRQAIVKATKLLGKESAASIIREALNDESPEVVRLAEKEIDSRWSDVVWE